MPLIRFKDKDKSGHVLGLGVVSNEWREVSDADLAYFEAMNTRSESPDEDGNRKVLSKQTLEDYGIEVKTVSDTSKKKEEDS